MAELDTGMRRREGAQAPQLTIDEWVLLAMFAGLAYAVQDTPRFVAILFGIVILYLSVGAFLPLRWKYPAKFFLLALTIGLFVLGFALYEIVARHASAPYLLAHDGLIQTEEAVKFLLAGKDPYGANYSSTPMAQWEPKVGNLTENPALYHNAYLPFLFLFNAPFYLLLNSVLGWFDGRMVFLPLFLGLLVILARWAGESDKRYALVWMIALNPFFAPYLIEGRNDVFVLFWIVLSLELLRHRHERLSLVALGLACASKLTAWFLIPFYVLYLLQPDPEGFWRWLRANVVSGARRTAPLVGTIAVIVLPFLFWQPAAFWTDVWSYPNGTSALAPYPVSGFGFNSLMQWLGFLAPDALRSPFEILQWVIGLPLLVVLSWRQVRRNTLPEMWFSYALLLAAMSFFSHVLNDNHIGFILILLAVAAFTDNIPPHPAEVGSHG